MRMRRKLIYMLFLVLGSFLLAGTGIAGDTGISDLGQAVKAAQAKLAPKAGTPSEEGKEAVSEPLLEVSALNAAALETAVLVTDLDYSKKKLRYLEFEQEDLNGKLEKAENDFKMGKVDAKVRDEYKKMLVKNEFDLNYYKMQVENNLKNFSRLTGAVISEAFDFNGAYLIADAGKLTLPELIPAGVEPKDAEKKLGEAVEAYKSLGDLIDIYIKAADKLTEAESDFKKGKAGKEAVDAANAEKEKARINAYEGKLLYSKLLYELDCSLQGYIAREIKKAPEPIFIQQ